MEKISSRLTGIYLGYTLVLSLLFFWVNVLRFQAFGLNTYDFGIYLEHVQRFSFSEWNPISYAFGVRLFNDHWHPFLLLAKIPTLLGIPSAYALIVTEIFFTLILPAFFIHRWRGSALFIPALAALLVFFSSKFFWRAMFYPVHPSFWGMSVLFLLGLTLSDKKTAEIERWFIRGSIPATYLLSGFGEQFALCFLVPNLLLGLFALREKRIKVALLFICESVVMIGWAAFCLSGRAVLFGEVVPQTDRVSFGLESIRLGFFENADFWKNLGAVAVTILPLYWLRDPKKKKSTQFRVELSDLLVLALYLPLISGRFLSRANGFHYDAVYAALTGNVVFLLALRFPLRIKWIPFFIPLGLVIHLSQVREIYRYLVEPDKGLNGGSEVVDRQERRYQIQEALNVLKALRAEPETKLLDSEIFTSHSLVPTLLSEFPDAVIRTKLEDFKSGMVLLERGNFGDPWTKAGQKSEAFYAQLKDETKKHPDAKRARVLFDIPNLYLAVYFLR